jgi:16S rRNA (cytosine967-C5)-methyltransferase
MSKHRSLSSPGPREEALRILRECEKRKVPLKTLLENEPSQADPRDRNLTHELVLGTLRLRNRLDFVMAALSGVPPERIEKELLPVLRLGAYQLLFLDRIPKYAAVHETVALAPGSRAASFVNAVLRKLADTGSSVELPKPDTDPERFLEVTLSHPRWLVRRWLKRFGFEATARLCEENDRHATNTFFENPLHPDSDSFERLLREEDGIDFEPFPGIPGCHRTEASLRNTRALREGLIQVQDPASRLISLLLGAGPGERILDACAAPGGKSAALACRMENRGLIIASDISFPRLATAAEYLERLRVKIAVPVAADIAESPPFGALFDRVLVDAPCTGTGTLRDNPDIKWHLTAPAVLRASGIQEALLQSVSRLVRPGGTLAYSTCSLEEEENELVVRRFLKKNQEFALLPCGDRMSPVLAAFSTPEGFFRSYPHVHGTDGFFGAILVRGPSR